MLAMIVRILSCLLLLAGLSGAAQSAAPAAAALPKNPRAILDAAAPYYNFSDPALNPWHLKATYQLYDENGKPTEQGIFEYWWASPEVHRSSWTRPGATLNVWLTPEGMATVKGGGALGSYEARIPSLLTTPLSGAKISNASNARLERNDLKTGQGSIPCISVLPSAEKLQKDFRFFPTYCFDALPVLRMSYEMGGLVSITYNDIGRLEGRALAKDIRVFVGEKNRLSLKADLVEPLDASSPTLVPPKDATISRLVDVHPIQKFQPPTLVYQVPPAYPPLAGPTRVSGQVLLEAVIGTDGKVKDARVISSPSPLLSESALAAVKHWKYKPATADGEPVESRIAITTSFMPQ